MYANPNKYNSVVETFVGDPFTTALLSTKATPPASITYVTGAGDFTDQEIYSRSNMNTAAVDGRRFGKFEINDIPRILAYGLFCNIADGLVFADTGPAGGLGLTLFWNAYNALNVSTQANFTAVTGDSPRFQERIYTLNTLFPCDFRFDFSGLQTDLDHYRGKAGVLVSDEDAVFSTISVDPAYADLPLLFWPVFLIEHSIPIRQSEGF